MRNRMNGGMCAGNGQESNKRGSRHAKNQQMDKANWARSRRRGTTTKMGRRGGPRARDGHGGVNHAQSSARGPAGPPRRRRRGMCTFCESASPARRRRHQRPVSKAAGQGARAHPRHGGGGVGAGQSGRARPAPAPAPPRPPAKTTGPKSHLLAQKKQKNRKMKKQKQKERKSELAASPVGTAMARAMAGQYAGMQGHGRRARAAGCPPPTTGFHLRAPEKKWSNFVVDVSGSDQMRARLWRAVAARQGSHGCAGAMAVCRAIIAGLASRWRGRPAAARPFMPDTQQPRQNNFDSCLKKRQKKEERRKKEKERKRRKKRKEKERKNKAAPGKSERG